MFAYISEVLLYMVTGLCNMRVGSKKKDMSHIVHKYRCYRTGVYLKVRACLLCNFR